MKYLTLFSFCLLLTGCSSKVDTATFQVKTTPFTNEGTPFYALIKSTDYSTFLTEDYQKIAQQTISGEEDSSNLEIVHFIPGEMKTIKVPQTEKEPVAIYFLLTHPSGEWKYLIDEKETSKIKILLGENGIKSVRSF